MANKKPDQLVNLILSDFLVAETLDPSDTQALAKAYRKLTADLLMCKYISSGPLMIVGDIHGDFSILQDVVNFFVNLKKETHIVFLGDIVDRGSQSIACLNLLFSLALKYPGRVHILRGNHESVPINSRYGFLEEVRRFDGTLRLFDLYNSIFGQMPLAAVHKKLRIFLVHGGIPIEPCTLEDIENLPKNDLMLSNDITRQLLWNDPQEDIEREGFSMRGMNIYTFGSELISEFMSKNNLKLVVRAHQVFQEGYKYFFDKKMLSIFTSEEFYSQVQAKVALVNSNGKIRICSPREKIT